MIQKLQAKHPMPWTYVNHGGQLVMRDSSGNVVPLITMLDFIVLCTQTLGRQQPPNPKG